MTTPSTTTPVARSLFTTEHITDVREKMLAWRESASFIFDVNPLGNPLRDGFSAQIESYNFGKLITSVCQSVPASWRRTPSDTANNGLDHFLIQFYISGHGYFIDGHREIRTDPGEIYVLDAARDMHTRTVHFRNFTLWVPRILLAERMDDLSSLHGKVLAMDNPLTAVLREHLLLLHKQAGRMTAAQGERLASPTIDLLVSALRSGTHRDTLSAPDCSAPPIIALKQYIHQHLDSPTLDIVSVAANLRTSVAALNRISEPLGNIDDYIQQQRLQKVLRGLSNPDLYHLSVGQIASFWGFEDASRFNRLFRREFGVSPREARHLPYSTVAAQPATQQRTKEKTGADRHYENWITNLNA